MSSQLPSSFKGKICEIIGLGASNTALAEYLYAEGATLIFRDKTEPKHSVMKKLGSLGDRFIFGENYLSGINGEYIFRTPALHPYTRELKSAVSRGAVLTSECELFFERAPCRVIGVTGSDGKTGTVTLIQKILSEYFRENLRRVFSAGNIGLPLISLLPELNENDTVIAELSSFQLMTLKKAPFLSALTNISPNHLDYHKDIKEYINAKMNIIQADCQYISLPDADYSESWKTRAKAIGTKYEIRGYNSACDIYCDERSIRLYGEPILSTDDILLRGKHNTENYMTAISVCARYLRYIDALSNIKFKNCVRSVARSFSGVEHRMQLIYEKNGIRYYDSSIDTTPSRTATTLSCFSKPLTVICGGHDKGLEYDELAKALDIYADAVIVTGSAANKLLKCIERVNQPSFITVYEPDFEEAVRVAAKLTPIGGAVLLSPACASFDRFSSYKERSELFKKTVLSLK